MSLPSLQSEVAFLAIINDTRSKFDHSASRPRANYHSCVTVYPRASQARVFSELARCQSRFNIMKPHLVQAASEVIPSQQILVNMVSRRVRQLSMGHRPLVEFVPGLGHADIALSEIAAGKLVYESTYGQNGTNGATEVVTFPGIVAEKKPTKKRAA